MSDQRKGNRDDIQENCVVLCRAGPLPRIQRQGNSEEENDNRGPVFNNSIIFTMNVALLILLLTK